ncbi:MAG: DNA gyrase inhibitor YacG [Gallionella sp.]|nr:DNA gyrase inhibitor YacG [Gallionella sp.]
MSNHAPPIVRCPQCGKEMLWDTTNRYRPFCSERCKLVDLGKWASEDYRIEQPEQVFPDSNSEFPD